METTLTRVPVLFCATDPISRAGLGAALRVRPEVLLVDEDDDGSQTVVVVVADRLDEGVAQHLRSRQSRGQTRFVLVLSEPDDLDLMVLVELGIRAVARRSEATTDTLVRLVRAAASGDASLPPDLLNRLLTQVSRLQRQVLAPAGLSIAGLTRREIEVLRLVAQGLDTREIAERMCYSQRTVKTILHDVVNRFQLRNRSHAVAYAMREGLI